MTEPGAETEPCECRCADDLDPGDFGVQTLDIEGDPFLVFRCACFECPNLNGERCRALLTRSTEEVEEKCFACEESHEESSTEIRRRMPVFAGPDIRGCEGHFTW